MKNNKVAVIAKKEFFDSIRSKTFLIIFGIFLVLMLVSSVTGINNYDKQLDQYQKFQVENQNPDKNSVFTDFPEPKLTAVVFQEMVTNIGLIGAILAIILGYNTVSGEKERGNLKLLLSYPLYREDVVNGKFLGKIGVLILTLAVTSILSIACALVMGMNLTGSDLVAIILFMVISTLYLITFLGISIFFSTVSKSGTSSILNSFMFWILSTMIITSFSGIVADAMVPIDDTVFYGGKISSTDSVSIVVSDNGETNISKDDGESPFEKYQKNWKIQNMIESFISPTQNYEQIASAILGNDFVNSMTGSDSPQSEINMFEILSGKISNIITMFVWAIVSLIATYVVFMRQDIR
ncbi:MAG: type transport system permease protein [Planctomycetota bacterium]|nr:type transport system permease protein [Planctomycetota bacterium]